MTDRKKRTGQPILGSVAAHVYVADVRAACDFYTDTLGFTVEFVYGDPPFYGEVVRDRARLALRLVGEPVFAGDVRERRHLLAASITVASTAEIKHLFSSYRSAGARFHQTLKEEPWGAADFVVSDLDGNLILFAGPAD